MQQKLKRFSHDFQKKGFDFAYDKLTNNEYDKKVKYFVNSIKGEKDFFKRFLISISLFEGNYIKRFENIKNNVHCLPRRTKPHREIHSQLLMIINKSNWDDVEVLIDVYEARNEIEDIIFVTGDFKDILCHKEEIKNCLKINEIMPLKESGSHQ